MLRAWLGAGQGIIEGARGGGVGDKRRRILENGGEQFCGSFKRKRHANLSPAADLHCLLV